MFGRIASGEQLELHWWLRNADGLTDDKKRLYFACQRLITTPSVQQHFDSAVDHAAPGITPVVIKHSHFFHLKLSIFVEFKFLSECTRGF